MWRVRTLLSDRYLSLYPTTFGTFSSISPYGVRDTAGPPGEGKVSVDICPPLCPKELPTTGVIRPRCSRVLRDGRCTLGSDLRHPEEPGLIGFSLGPKR